MKIFSVISLITLGILALVFIVLACRDRKPGIGSKPGYHIVGDKVYYYVGFSNGSATEINEADAKTLVKLDEAGFPEATYAKDKNQVYYNGMVLKNADAASFRRIKRDYAADANHVFYMSLKLSNDPENFELLDDYVTKDRQYVYYSDRKISDHPDKFKKIGTSAGVGIDYYTDESAIFANSTKIEHADPKTFQTLPFAYSKDSRKVFLMESTNVIELPDADPGTFVALTNFYSKDKNRAYWRGEVIAGADPRNFKIISEEHHCSCDDKRAYYHKSVIPNADPAKFPADRKLKYCNENEIVFE